MSGPALAIAVVFVGLSLVAGCSSQTCLQREAVGYEELVTTAEGALAGVEFSLSPAGRCEDTGRPWTGAQAVVLEWPSRRIADRYFARLGWSYGERGLISPDGAFRVSNITSRDETVSPTTFVTVAFEEVGDEDEWLGG